MKNDSHQHLLRLLRGSNADERKLHRLHSVALVLQGMFPKEAAKFYGDSPRAVAYWVEQFKSLGIEGLEGKKPPGRPRSLDETQVKATCAFVGAAIRRKERMSSTVLANYISDSFGVSLSVRQSTRFLAELRHIIESSPARTRAIAKPRK